MSRQTQGKNQAKTVRDHIRELQMRFFACLIALTVAGCVVFAFYQPILKLLSSPLGSSLYYSNPAGGFGFVMKICLTGALIIAIPVLIYNIIMFARPAFEKVLPIKRVLTTTLSSTLLAICGAVFAYTIILPGSLNFFQGFQVDGLKALISADDYLTFVTNIIITFVIVFQIPLVISFIDKIKPLKPKTLLKMEKWVILGSLIIALVVPFTYEFFTSLLIAVPIIALYNLSIIVVLIQHTKAKRKEKVLAYTSIEKTVDNKFVDDFNLNDQSIEVFSEELAMVKTPTTVNVMVSNEVKNTNELAIGDVGCINKVDEVKVPAWVIERKMRREAINASAAKIIEDSNVDMVQAAKTDKVEIPAWVIERKMRREAINTSRVRIFSDIRPARQINRALALQ